ncbi:MAG: response regulator [Acidimicrobiia bacterium]|nr:response regulator [Acidimicrobiia bacterium]
MLKILFVDDQPSVLEETQRATQDMRHQWDMSFVAGADEAMDLLDREAFDVIVSDMRMPGLDGAELLFLVRSCSPSTARIMLSGCEEDELIFRSTRVAHQFLSKPCDVDQLKNAIAEIRAVQGVVSSEEIRALIGRVDQLPALGEVYQRLVQAIEADSSAQQLAAIVCEDVALTAEILRLLNSAFFGLSRRVESVEQAIGLLGTDVLRAIVAGYSVFSQPGRMVVDADVVSRRSQQVAALARHTHRILTDASRSELADVYLAGMLHEVGALVLGSIEGMDPVDAKAVLGSNDNTVERLAFGVDRFAVSSYLLGLWAFSSEVIQAVASLSGRLEPPMTSMGWSIAVARHIIVNNLADGLEAVDAEAIEKLIRSVDEQLVALAPPTPLTEPQDGVRSALI